MTNEHSLSIIILFRFYLDLLKWNVHGNTSPSSGLPTLSVESFHVATRGIQDATETGSGFDNPDPENRSESAASTGEVVMSVILEATIKVIWLFSELLSQGQHAEATVEV